MNYIVDTNTLNYIIKKIDPAIRRYEEALAAGHTFHLSMVVHYEVTRYLKLKEAAKLQRFYEELISTWRHIPLDFADWNAAATTWALRHRAGKPIEDADLLIAVEALKVGAVLVTNNVSHFDALGLTIENWAE